MGWTPYLCPPSADVYSSYLWQDFLVCSFYVVTELRHHYLPPALLTTHPGFLPLPNVTPSPINILLYAAVPDLPQRKPGVHTIALVLPRLVSSTTLLNNLTTTISVLWNQMGLCPAIHTKYA